MSQSYSFTVIAVKRILIGLIVLILCGVFILPIALNNHDRVQLKSIGKEDVTVEFTNQIIHPKLHGQDNQGKPYLITAESGSKLNDTLIQLINVTGKIKMDQEDEGSKYYYLSSKFGKSEQNSGIIYLYKDVILTDPDGYQALTQGMSIDYNQTYAVSDDDITIRGYNLLLTADKFEMLPGGNILIFKGNVKVLIE